MDAHRDPAVDILAPQQLGQIQRRPFNIALNIDRHEPQHARLDRRPPDGHRDDRLRKLRREARRQERRLQEGPKTVKPLCSQFPNTKKVQMAVVTLMTGLSLAIFLLYLISFMFMFVYYYRIGVYYYGSFVHSNTTDTNLKTSLNQVNRQVARIFWWHDVFCMIGCGFWTIACGVCLLYIVWHITQPVNCLKVSTEVAYYRNLSLGSYATALILALANGYNIYAIYGLSNVATLISGLPFELIDLIRNFYYSNLQHMVMVNLVGLVEWLFGCVLYQIEHSLLAQVASPGMAIICGIVTVIVNVCVIMIY